MKKRVAVALSGGVDSAAAAAILKKEGFDVVGVTMSIWDGSLNLGLNIKNSCCAPSEKENLKSAIDVAETLKIPHKIYDLSREFKERVICYLKNEYIKGKTPNPCAMCNREMKFGELFKRAEIDFGVDFFATGHYARIVKEGALFFIGQAADLSKDQSYFLQRLDKERLPRLIFPLGKMTKRQARDIVGEFGAVAAEKAESQDFMGGRYSQLFSDDKIEEGDIVDESGRILGKHKGVVHYTVGQRRGLGISNPKPLFVLKIDAENNRIVVTERENLFSDALIASSLNLFVDLESFNNLKTLVKIRQKHKEAPARVSVLDKNRFKLIFETPQLSVTPGQAAAFYNDRGLLLGSGIIKRAFNNNEERE